MRREALSRDGYIVNQHETFDEPFGCRTSDYNGCGWIACYNLLRALEHETPPDSIRRELSRFSLFRGLFGSSLFKVHRCLRAHGVPVKTRLFINPICRAADDARGGILLYRHKGGWHYVAFIADGAPGVFRFFNAVSGNERHVLAMQEFLCSAPVSKLMLAFLAE